MFCFTNYGLYLDRSASLTVAAGSLVRDCPCLSVCPAATVIQPRINTRVKRMDLRSDKLLEKILPIHSYPEPEARTEPRSTTQSCWSLLVVPTPGGETWSCVPSIVLMEDLCPAVQFYVEHVAGVAIVVASVDTSIPFHLFMIMTSERVAHFVW